jgi:hypothetical protein
LPQALVITKQEELVLDDRPANSAAELIPLETRLYAGRSLVKEIARVQLRVAIEPERAAVNGIRPGL